MSILSFYQEYFDPQNGDPSTTKLPLLGRPLPLWILSALYLLFVLKLGPKFMKHHAPLNLKNCLLIYNFLQIVLNLIIGCMGASIQVYYRAYDLGCCRTLPVGHAQKSLEMWTSYAYFLMKIVDLLDTVFFVLRKSTKQITFLHVYHHIMMVNCVYTMLHFFGAGGELYVTIVLNSFVHSVMYAYYLITAVFPKLRTRILPWKKYVTLMQLLQFVILIVYNSYPLLFRSDCAFSSFEAFIVLQGFIVLALFTNFYVNAYSTEKLKIKY